MIPDKFNMVDMGGIDLILMQGETVPGLYDRLVGSIAACRYQCLYNWMFNGIPVPPTYVMLTFDDEGNIVINEGVIVTEEDVIHIYSLEPPPIPPVIESITLTENGVYEAPAGVDGYSPITVQVSGGGYWRVRVYYGGVLIDTEYVENGDPFTYSEGTVIDYDSTSCSVISLSVASVTQNIDLNLEDGTQTTRMYSGTIHQYSSVKSLFVSNNDLIVVCGPQVSVNSMGVIGSSSGSVSFECRDSTYNQYGTCNENATLPSVVNTGANRLTYNTISNNVPGSVTPGVNRFFLSVRGEDSTLIIKNFLI